MSEKAGGILRAEASNTEAGSRKLPSDGEEVSATESRIIHQLKLARDTTQESIDKCRE